MKKSSLQRYLYSYPLYPLLDLGWKKLNIVGTIAITTIILKIVGLSKTK